MSALQQQAPVRSDEEAEPMRTFLNELLAVLQKLQLQLQKLPPAEENTEAPPVVQRMQVADAHWVATLVEIQSIYTGRLLVMEARHRQPDWTRLLQLRRHPLLANVPLLVVLEKDDPRAITEAYRMGADACLIRPVHPAQLLGMALYLVRQGRRRAA
ncbi:MAG: histidine kinase [Rhodothermus sp.]|nr:histidine kinase [Rhodothermus sp.]